LSYPQLGIISEMSPPALTNCTRMNWLRLIDGRLCPELRLLLNKADAGCRREIAGHFNGVMGVLPLNHG
jgi:hypothetical protein